MLKDGTYAAWFKTLQAKAPALSMSPEGKIWGRDGVMTYSGSLRSRRKSIYRDRLDKKAYRRAVASLAEAAVSFESRGHFLFATANEKGRRRCALRPCPGKIDCPCNENTSSPGAL
jgi:hypothetical protein